MTEGGTITIDIEETTLAASDPDLSPGRYISIAVTDTGKGMDAETLRRAVEPFFSTKGVGKGTGLGLSMIHGLALQLHGSFTLTSSPGIGTTAKMLLPAADKKAPMSDPVLDVAPVAASPAGRSRILVVDDDALIAMSTAAMVEDLGHDVLEANSGTAALGIIKSGTQIDLMITDFSMPKMSGAELILAARQLLPDLPIILASGYAELPGDFKLDVVRLGKPYRESQLEEQINLALGDLGV
jgi:CheY-like chemotaxis protein